jgi:hypothetical protein
MASVKVKNHQYKERKKRGQGRVWTYDGHAQPQLSIVVPPADQAMKIDVDVAMPSAKKL